MRPLEFTSSMFLNFSELWLHSKGFGNQCVFCDEPLVSEVSLNI